MNKHETQGPQVDQNADEAQLRQAQALGIVSRCEWTVLTLRRRGRGWSVVRRDRERLRLAFAAYRRSLIRDRWALVIPLWRKQSATLLFRREVALADIRPPR